jgi:3-oxoacyl-[acyl-carrier protein] reductase
MQLASLRAIRYYVRMNKVAAITGGAGAIGGAIAGALGESGHTVAVLDRDAGFPVDLARQDDVRSAAAAVLAQHGRVDVLVHSAAAFDLASLSELELDTWRYVQAVNVESVLWLCQAVVPSMTRERFGRIVLVVSDTVWDPPTDALLPYVASKAALIGVARVLARALGRHGITVNCVAPGLTRTPASESGMPADAFESVLSRQALPRTLVPEDTAAAVAFLASEAAAAVTGQTICTDGGLILR